ncbi:MAG: mechanosensitive ion channel [Cyclobacteriaceae bacterium]|nr:mechanosensitive ion channel [Cyclobacteriaceae bacterium]
MDTVKNIIEVFWNFLKKLSAFIHIELFTIGETHVTLSTMLYIFVAIFILIYLSGKVKKIVTRNIINKYNTNPGTVQSIATISRYLVLTFGVVIILQSAGIDLSALSLMAGALGVGIGFGLQNVTNNFISGLIILFEQPIKVGDRVRVGDIEGDVVRISIRATQVITNDNITLIIPNAEFISSTVINWSHNDTMVALRFPVGVSYKENPEQVKEIILNVLEHLEGILPEPAPEVLFDEYGESSLNFIARIWTTKYMNRPGRLKSMFYYSLFKSFKTAGIEIPYPQRDIHIKSGNVSKHL